VCGKNGKDVVYVCDETNHPALFFDEILVENFNWLLSGDDLKNENVLFKCRTRHLQVHSERKTRSEATINEQR